ncbi:MAG: MBG domain-containing protein [Limisphaerales bacterium]
MKKSLMLLWVGALLAADGLAMSARAQSNVVVYAAEYKQSTNRFGTINLLNGAFTQISSYGSAVMNDIAYCPTNGLLYGISNTASLVTFNQTNGTIARIANLSVSGIESLAFRPSDSALFGATSSKLYTINPANGTATLVGSYGTPKNLGTGQNIRFAQDGNLYVSNTSTNTDIYRVNTTNGAATWMGEAIGYPYLTLENASSNMYGVFINLGSVTNPVPELATLNLSSFVVGGTNANGSTHQITLSLVGAGTNFPPNFNFSGNVPQAVTNLTVPVSATGPSNQTAVVGNNVVFSTVASGTGPYTYTWLENGVAISGQNNSSLTLNNVTTANAATYSVIVGGAIGTVTNSATLTVTKASASVTLGSLSQTYSGSAEAATATTTPGGLAVTFTYNGSASAPTNAGSYSVVGTINDPNYQGSATNTLVIAQASGSIVLGSLSQTFNGSAKPATAITSPSGLAVTFTYNGSANAPTNAASYTVVGTINNPIYTGSASGTLVIAPASASVTLGSLSQTYSGSAEAATATTTPSGLAVTFTYNGSTTVPTSAGSYAVVGTINNPNYTGSASGTLVIAPASASVTLGSLSQTYSGSAEAATATTTPSGLAVTFTYNGSTTVPVSAGSYAVVGTINDPNYTGSATGTLVIAPASASVTLGSLSQTYSGSAEAATATTTPSGLTVTFTYNGSATVPVNAGTYTVVGTINDPNYQGNATGTLVIAQALGSLTLGNLGQTYSGSAEAATATTTPSGLAVTFTYNGSDNVPTNAGSYTVVGTINDANYQGSATNTLVIGKAILTVAADDKNKICGMPNPPLTASYNGFVNGESANVLASPVTLNTTATTISGAGMYPITAGGAAAVNYTVNYVNGTLRVVAAPQLSSASVNVNGDQQFIVSWPTITGQNYQLQYSDDLSTGTWTPMGTSFPGTGVAVAVTNYTAASSHRFFRVQVQ